MRFHVAGRVSSFGGDSAGRFSIVWGNSSLVVFGTVLALSFGSGGAAWADFQEGRIFVSGSTSAAVFEFDPDFNLVSSWTHPSFGVAGQFYTAGPGGMAFDADGNLVVAALSELCVFSAPGVLVGCHPKTSSELTENLVFDTDQNVYTTTATGGSNNIQKYDANLDPVTTFPLPTGNLTGITCDRNGDLYIASANCGCIYKVDGTTFAILDTIPGFGSGLLSVEGIQYTYDDDLLVARSNSGDIMRVEASSPLMILDSMDAPSLLYPAPLTIDNDGNIYTGDFEDGYGSVGADLFKFDSGGTLVDSVLPSGVQGPFGIVVAGTVLPCGAFQDRAVPGMSHWSQAVLVFLLLASVAFVRRGLVS